jgi:hypothetical protein
MNQQEMTESMARKRAQMDAFYAAHSPHLAEEEQLSKALRELASPVSQQRSTTATTAHHITAVRHAESQFKGCVWNALVHLSWQHHIEVMVSRRGEETVIGPVSVSSRLCLTRTGTSRGFQVGELIFASEEVASMGEVAGIITITLS